MEKDRLFRIMVHSPAGVLTALSMEIENAYDVKVIKAPQKVLAMIRIRECVRDSEFYLGELLSSEAMVEINGSKGVAVTMGDDYAKVFAMAVLDAADNASLPEFASRIEPELILMESRIQKDRERENGMYLKTMVNFHSMDSEALHENIS